ncbi:MAG: toll/interleukin-1 receptor domain-containing protein, partial [Saprospiraceae bacterium]
MAKPVVFISYSWDDNDHKLWVKSLADRLVEEGGVDVILDKDDCPPGSDFLHFMEQSLVKANKVIIIMTPKYKDKAEGRITGVGYETCMILHEIYSQDINNSKFIPVLRQGPAQEATPKVLLSKVSVDMQTEELESFQDLLKAIHEYSEKPTPKSIPDWLKSKIEPDALSASIPPAST